MRDLYGLKIRLIGLGIVLVGLAILAYLIDSHGEIVVVLGAIVAAAAIAGGASVKSDDKAKTSKISSEPGALSRSLGKWWRG